MWCPAIGALPTRKFLGRPIACLGWQWGQTRYQIVSYLIPLGYSTFTYSIAWLTGIAALNPIQSADAFTRLFGFGPLSRSLGIGLYVLVVATIGVIQNCATTLGEEIGLRGFLVPELAKRFSFTATAVLSGSIWPLWHMPIILLAGYNAGTGWYGLAVVSANMIALLLRADMAAPEVRQLVHRRHSARFQQPLHPTVLRPMTAYTGGTKYILGEFAIGFTLVVAALAAYF